MRIRSRLSKRWWIALAIVSITLISVGLTAFMLSQPAHTPESTTKSSHNPPSKNTQKKPVEQSVSFSAMGDMLAHDSVVNQARQADGYNFLPYFDEIIPEISKSDVIFCNPETPSTSKLSISGYPSFNAPDEFPRDLRKVGCNLINLASNHIVDKGQIGLDRTLDNWQKQQPLAISGANKSAVDQQKISYFEKNKLKIAFLAFADFSNSAPPNSYSVNIYHDKALVEKLVTEARQNADVVVVSAHWGTEDSHQVNQDQLDSAKLFSDLGADVIIGTGPHVLQEVSTLERADGSKTLVWYSIGNMLSSQLQLDELTGGIAKFKITKSKDNLEFSDISFLPTFMSYRWDASAKASNRLDLRYDLKLKLLKNSQEEVKLFDTTIDERTQKVQQWLGNKVIVTP